MRIWIDTDVGSDVDDALAIAYAIRRPELELVGLSTVFGDVELRSRIARRLLELGRADSVPVVTGLGRPLTEARIGRMFGHEGIGLLEAPVVSNKTLENVEFDRTLDALASALERAAPDVVVSIGPMTNLGALARLGLDLPPLAVMGGHVDRSRSWPDQIEGIAEWNWWCDGEAAEEALAASRDRPPLIVPGEVTFGTELLPADRDRLAKGDPLARMLAVLSDEWLLAQRDRLGAKRPCVRLHDPLTVAALVDPELAPRARRRIRVDGEGVTRGDDAGTWVDVVNDTDNDALCAHLMETWLG